MKVPGLWHRPSLIRVIIFLPLLLPTCFFMHWDWGELRFPFLWKSPQLLLDLCVWGSYIWLPISTVPGLISSLVWHVPNPSITYKWWLDSFCKVYFGFQYSFVHGRCLSWQRRDRDLIKNPIIFDEIELTDHRCTQWFSLAQYTQST